MKLSLHWKVKGLIQLFLSKIPFGLYLNKQLQILNGSYKDEVILENVLEQSKQISEFNKRKSIAGNSVLEIGTGWNLIGVILFHLKGAKIIYGFDINRNASYNIAKRLVFLVNQNLILVSEALGVDKSILKNSCKKLLSTKSEDDFFSILNFLYKAPGDLRNTKLKSESIDIIFSHGVLEHIPTKDLVDIFIESKRITKKNGKHFHVIGTHDHYDYAGLGNGVNFLRYSSWHWFLMTGNSLSYHNRLRMSDYQRIFRNIGFKIEFEDKDLHKKDLEILESLPLNIIFEGYSKEDLATSIYYVDLAR